MNPALAEADFRPANPLVAKSQCFSRALQTDSPRSALRSTCQPACCNLRLMNIEWVRRFCLSLPSATEQVQWGSDLVFKVGGKLFAVMPLEPGGPWLSFKCSPEDFAELIERPEIRPAAYLARAHWVSLETESALSREEVERLIRQSHGLVASRLPKKVQAKLLDGGKQAAWKHGRKTGQGRDSH
ncbi:MAG TPA: MmcQ/YjbR family DNA-binding protein [Candidatus Acidoferrales bacterium]|nr:MmcQ/YjbR family DNA-binding protein [Candidatus Acidoferrales bacterium]